ncbi:hypothetical protein [Teichococcus aerofrigidensis]
MSEPELDSLIVQHLADLDRTTLRIGLIQGLVLEALCEIVAEWAEENGWHADFKMAEDGIWFADCWLAPRGWRTKDSKKEDAYDAWFELDAGAGDDQEWREGQDTWFLTRLCRVGFGQVGLKFKTDLRKGRAWKQAFAQMGEIVKDTKFAPDAEYSFFLPFNLEAAALARALEEENVGSALEPFSSILEELRRALPAFDNVVQHLRPEVT